MNQFFFEFDLGYQSEDCLSLNVWTPAVNDNRKRPVMVWLHSGGFVTGSAHELPSYDGRNLARRGEVVVVSVNHRLNAFFSAAREQWTDADMRAELARRPLSVPGSVLDALRQAYPAARPVELYAHTVNQGGLAYRADAVSLAGHKAAQASAPAYLYQFAWKTRVMDGRPRAFHRTELPFVFDNTDRCANQTGGTDEARAMAARMSDAWIAFARNGDPNHAGLPSWPAFTIDRVPTMVFDNDCEVRFDHDRAARSAWLNSWPPR